MSLFKWSRTAASNAIADPSINWQEGQSPSSVNDSARAMMASIAKYRDDITGAIFTGGTATAYSVASHQAFDTLTRLDGQIIAFTPHVTNEATVTLNVDSLGAKPLRSAPATELLAGVLIQGTPYTAVYNQSDQAWYLQNFYGNPYNVPLAAGMDYWGSSAPNSSFAFPVGQAISRATYAALFAVIGTTYGSGNGTTTFNLPDKRGRISAALDGMGGAAASRLTDAITGFGDTLGEAGGSQTKTLSTANLPAYTPSGSITNGAITVSSNAAGLTNGGAIPAGGGQVTTIQQTFSVSQAASAFNGSAQGGVSEPVNIVQPTIVCNYIVRII